MSRGMAHDLNNMLQSILANLSMTMLPDTAPDELAELTRHHQRWHRAEVEFSCPHTIAHSPLIGAIARSVVTELLFNAARHAPGAAVRVRVEESGANLIPGFAYSAPMEDLKLKAR